MKFALALAVTALAVAAPSASADDVWLWACHGPAGEALSPPLGEHATASGAATASCADGAMRAPQNSSWTFSMPSNVALEQVRVIRSVAIGAEDSYRLSAGGATLESSGDGTDKTYPATGSQVAFDVTCMTDCAGATVSAIGFKVNDSTAPQGSAGGLRSPADGSLDLNVLGNDVGVGLRDAVVYMDGQPVTSGAYGPCTDVSASPGVDLAFGLVGQSDAGTPPKPVGCIGRGAVTIPLDTRAFANGVHQLTIRVNDLAGNSTVVADQPFEVDNPIPPASTSTTTSGSTRTGAGGSSSSDLATATATTCASPKLKVKLSDKPLSRKKGVAVIRSGERYLFTGRLTCLNGKKRRDAPSKAILDVFSRIKKTTKDDYGTTTAPKGIVHQILSFTQSRTLVFRFTSAQGRSVEVKIPLIVQKAKAFPSKASIRGVWLRFETPSDRVRFSSLEARNVPKGAAVTIHCTGEGCPSGDRIVRSKRNRTSMSVLGNLTSVSLRPGASVDVTITKPGFVGVGKLYCVRAGQKVQTKAYKVTDTKPTCG